jgi:glycosyltransferase involved in cell wall biosynthesis
MDRFRTDLEHLLFFVECSPNDHVFLPTAHGRELAAVLDMTSRWPAGSAPTFHFEFRHALVLGDDGILSDRDPYSQAHAAFFQFARSFAPSDRVRLYTDSDGLSQEYESVSGLDFGVLPIPFRSQFIDMKARDAKPLQVGYFGDVRDEKGFHWLPEVIDAMMDQYIRPGRVKFLIQASLIHPEYEPKSTQALERLKAFPPDVVRLVGLNGPLTPESYYQLVSEVDLLLCPYDPTTYRNRTSGTLTEAIAAGTPTVVPHGSWLSRQQPENSGETFADLQSFINAVKRICDDYRRYQAHARSGRHSWLSLHSPAGLLSSLLCHPKDDRSQVGKVA